jgi:SWI/SNF-related matrix-associated actin-dependent regulator 1 of chromatin subfamily A
LGLVDAQVNLKKEQEKQLYEDGRIVMPYNPEALPFLRSLPGAKWDSGNKCWRCSTAPKDLPRLLEVVQKLGLQVPEELKTQRENGTQQSREALDRAKRVRTDGQPLYPFQPDGVEFLALHDRALLADDMGLGKTVQALVALPKDAPVIVVCPAAVKYNWQHEINLWRPDYRATIVSGKKGFRLPDNGEIVIVNYDILPAWLSPTEVVGKTSRGKDIKRAPLTADQRDKIERTYLIADEAHLVKNYKTQRAKKITELSRVTKATWFLTGTPLMNRPFDLFGVLTSGGMDPFGGFYGFLRAFNGSKGRWGGYEFGSPTSEAPEKLRRVMLRRLKSEVLTDLPPKNYQEIVVNGLSGSLVKEMDAAMLEWMGDNDVDEVDSVDVLPPFEVFSKLRAKLAESRIPAMVEIVEGYEESEVPVVVFSAHRSPIDYLANRDGWAAITGDTSSQDRQKIVVDFQAGRLKGVGLTIQAGGVGLTLTRAANALFVDLDWTPALNVQAEDRICRIGQRSSSITIQRLVSDHPLDKHVQKLLAQKIELIYKALDKKTTYRDKVIVDEIAPELVQETEEELMARIKNVADKVEKEFAQGKVQAIYEKGYTTWSEDRPEPELTLERKELLRNALSYMCSICDGAFKRDGEGFNKPDARIGHWLNATGLEEDNETGFRVAEMVLSKYHRQLKGEFCEIWKPCMEKRHNEKQSHFVQRVERVKNSMAEVMDGSDV